MSYLEDQCKIVLRGLLVKSPYILSFCAKEFDNLFFYYVDANIDTNCDNHSKYITILSLTKLPVNLPRAKYINDNYLNIGAMSNNTKWLIDKPTKVMSNDLNYHLVDKTCLKAIMNLGIMI